MGLKRVDGLAGEGKGVAKDDAGVVLERLFGEVVGSDGDNGLRAAEGGS